MDYSKENITLLILFSLGWLVYYPLAEKKYWKISWGVMVILRKNIEFSSEEPKTPRKKIQYFSEGLPSPQVIFSNTFVSQWVITIIDHEWQLDGH